MTPPKKTEILKNILAARLKYSQRSDRQHAAQCKRTHLLTVNQSAPRRHESLSSDQTRLSTSQDQAGCTEQLTTVISTSLNASHTHTHTHTRDQQIVSVFTSSVITSTLHVPNVLSASVCLSVCVVIQAARYIRPPNVAYTGSSNTPTYVGVYGLSQSVLGSGVVGPCVKRPLIPLTGFVNLQCQQAIHILW